jgi:hypothetical protein
MNTNMTEGQKKGLMILGTVLLCIVMLTSAIMPMNAMIEENEIKAEEVTARAEVMRGHINAVGRTDEYETLRVESQLTFDRNYRSFRANEKIEEILDEMGIELKSIDISPYVSLSTQDYEMNVVQPRTEELYREMQSTMNGSLMNLFLVSRIQISIETTLEEALRVVDAINNIPPEGPGEAEIARYCLHIPILAVQRGDIGGSDTHSIAINMYGMQPPPIQATEIAESED